MGSWGVQNTAGDIRTIGLKSLTSGYADMSPSPRYCVLSLDPLNLWDNLYLKVYLRRRPDFPGAATSGVRVPSHILLASATISRAT